MPRYDDDRPRRNWDDEDRPRRRRHDDDDDRYARYPAKKSNSGLIIGIVVGTFLIVCGGGGALVYFAFLSAKKSIEQMEKEMAAAEAEAEAEESEMNLQDIGEAIRAYEAAHGFLPNNSYDERGRPLLSWRVHILPYINEGELYRKFRLNEPWDSDHNRRLMDEMPIEFEVGDPDTVNGMTYYRGFSHVGSLFEKPRDGHPAPPRLTLAGGFPDGQVSTILVVEAGQAVEWTKPDDLDWGAGQPRPALGGVNPKRQFFLAVMADGSVKRIRRDVEDNILRLLIDRRDGKPIPPTWEFTDTNPAK